MPTLTKRKPQQTPKSSYVGLDPLLAKINSNPYFEDKTKSFVLFKEDSLKLLSLIPEESIDMIFADPPYFLSNGGITCQAGKMVSVNKGKWDASNGIEDNHLFNLRWLKECQRILKANGTIWVSGTSHIIHSIGFAMQTLHYKILNDIAWFKVNPPPNLSCRYFTHSTETILWAAKSTKSKHYFNYPLMRKLNNNKQMLSLWHIKAPGASEKIYGKHPTQKPIQLLERIIQAATIKGNIVVDPFTGSSTTGLEAYKLGRKYIGIDSEKEYLELSIKRFKDIK
ncbi:site-specific DNA-methyltransferase [bacterium]|nr:site-specific DNA-methyltransferase [bacterium]MBU1853685.1 site-specific DNA-methyltransferase [Candidatus Omnitrophota bacterium]